MLAGSGFVEIGPNLDGNCTELLFRAEDENLPEVKKWSERGELRLLDTLNWLGLKNIVVKILVYVLKTIELIF
jgi:hypothetical protein